MINKKTIIVGATPNTTRYAYTAAGMLQKYHVEFVPIGIKRGEVFGKQILDIRIEPEISDVHTITLYIGPQHQPDYYEYLISLSPKRVIFNPGTENIDFQNELSQSGVEVVTACTLVMLSTGQY